MCRFATSVGGAAALAFLVSACGGQKETVRTVTPGKIKETTPVGSLQRFPMFANVPNCLANGIKVNRPRCWALETGSNDAFVRYAKKLGPTPRDHSNSADAIGNLVECVRGGERDPVLIGHGRPGMICTGSGAACWSSNPVKLSSEDGNQKFWNGWFGRVGALESAPASLRLVSCSTGAGRGAELLHELANRFHCPVKAWTYFVWTDGTEIWLDPDGDWQTAMPGPDAPREKQGPIVSADGSASPVVFHNGVQVPIGPGELLITQLKDVRLFGRMTGFDVPVDPVPGASLAAFGNLSRACYSGMASASIEDAVVVMKSRDGKITKEFALLSGGLLQDREYQGIHYRVDSRFAGALANLADQYRETHRIP